MRCYDLAIERRGMDGRGVNGRGVNGCGVNGGRMNGGGVNRWVDDRYRSGPQPGNAIDRNTMINLPNGRLIRFVSRARSGRLPVRSGNPFALVDGSLAARLLGGHRGDGSCQQHCTQTEGNSDRTHWRHRDV